MGNINTTWKWLSMVDKSSGAFIINPIHKDVSSLTEYIGLSQYNNSLRNKRTNNQTTVSQEDMIKIKQTSIVYIEPWIAYLEDMDEYPILSTLLAL